MQVRMAAIRVLASSHYPKAEIDGWCASRTAATYRASIERQAMLVEEMEGVVVAFGLLNQEATHIDGVYVYPSHSRQGVGLRILRALEAMAAERGIKAITLDASLNAVEFYRQAGYVPVTEKKHVHCDESTAAVVVMRHEIREAVD